MSVLTFLHFGALFASPIAAIEPRDNTDDNPLYGCTTITASAPFYACVNSAIDGFTSTNPLTDTTTLDSSSLVSFINSLGNDLTSYAITLSSLGDPATFTGASVSSGPYVPDIVSSYSEYSKTHTPGESSGSVYSFETSKWTPPTPSSTPSIPIPTSSIPISSSSVASSSTTSRTMPSITSVSTTSTSMTSTISSAGSSSSEKTSSVLSSASLTVQSTTSTDAATYIDVKPHSWIAGLVWIMMMLW